MIHTNFWTLLESYDSKKYNFNFQKEENKISIIISRKFRFIGFEISKEVKKIVWDIQQSRDVFGSILNPAFIDDSAVDCLSYMQYAEKGFNENITGNFHLDILHCAVGLSSESGEVLDLIKKHVYHSKPISITEMVDELSDMQWYLFNLMRLYEISFSNVLKANVIKLNARYPNGRDKNMLAAVKNKKNEFDSIKSQLNLES